MTLIEEELARISPDRDTALTIGVFDGVHLGHRELLAKVKELARQQDLLSGVITFSQHPREVISPQTRLPMLTDLEERRRLLKNEGMNFVVILSFGPEVARLDARSFIGLIKKYLRVRALVVGPDFALGRGREGDAAALRKLGRELGFTVTVVPPVTVQGERVSSTAIRSALAAGNMKTVRRLTGRFFRLHGPVVSGERRGAGLGFPTANIQANENQALPADGIYATRAFLGGREYQSVTNIGRRPTFNGADRTVEVYILDFSGDIYGKVLEIEIIERLREEKCFNTIEDLKKQMAEDVKATRALLAGTNER